MGDYAITTDSSCDFDQALADSLGVTVVPLSVQIGPRRFRNAPGEAMTATASTSCSAKENWPRPPPPTWRSSRPSGGPSCKAGGTFFTWAFPPA